jgi:hypothetical protein
MDKKNVQKQKSKTLLEGQKRENLKEERNILFYKNNLKKNR